MDLSGSFSNPRPEVKLLVRRVLRCRTARQERPRQPQMSDSRGPIVRELKNAQTLLRPAQVAPLVDEYRQGVPVGELAARYNVHRTTVSEHARRHGLLPRRRSLDEDERARAAGLYVDGLSMSAIAQRFGVGRSAIRTALVANGVAIGVPGRRRAPV